MSTLKQRQSETSVLYWRFSAFIVNNVTHNVDNVKLQTKGTSEGSGQTKHLNLICLGLVTICSGLFVDKLCHVWL